MKIEKWADDIIQNIADALAGCDGEYIANIANQVLVGKVTYLEDSMFEIEYEDDLHDI